ncbi:hypothetical protein EB796_000017 [Bugula neritina]|uniref:Uncharacterized protein n=1 Tax=Bugula neritina TaxID=10212 RepID=A0A7J7KU21_BUGNE|nr:hypothetical protein EB796_000017 [Bugula neritina]
MILKLFAGPKVELKVKLAEVSRKEDQLPALQFERCEIAVWVECVYSARLHSHDSTSELYSCIKGKYQTKLFSQLTNAAEVI